MPHHVVFLEGAEAQPGQTVAIEGDEARHALKSKRLRPAERVLILAGEGVVYDAEVVDARKTLSLRVLERRQTPPTSPNVEVWSPAPKGPRASDLVELVSQAGAAAWRPLRTERTVQPASDKKRSRLERVAIESAKQCRRAWILRIERETSLDHALDNTHEAKLEAGLEAEPETAGAALVLADAAGAPYTPTGAAHVRLLVGPEGGWDERERERAGAAGARVCSFGPHAMRIETACAVAVAIVLNAERARP